jgi:type II secretory pathway pseudopilin PulG
MRYLQEQAMKRPLSSHSSGFTLLELLTVITIIIVLAGLILSGAGFAQQKAARDRASAEIAALSVALESYKADNGEYPRDSSTDALNAVTTIALASNNATATGASLCLYKALSGDMDASRGKSDGDERRYMEFKADMLAPANGTTVSYLVDPFGNPYGYSTKYAADVASGAATPGGYNPTFDLWSSGGASDVSKRISNW